MEHPIITKNYAENSSGGIMLCGINFGLSIEDERNELSGSEVLTEEKSFFSDEIVNNSRFKKTIIKWFDLWGMPLTSDPDALGNLEKSIFQTNWLNTQSRSTTSEDKIDRNYLAHNAKSFINLLRERKPRIIIFFSVDLLEAINFSIIRDEIESILGPWPGKATTHPSPLTNYQGKKLKVMTQDYPQTKIIALPHPQAHGLTDEYIGSFGPIIKQYVDTH